MRLALPIPGKLLIVSKLLDRFTFNEAVVPVEPSIVLILFGLALITSISKPEIVSVPRPPDLAIIPPREKVRSALTLE